MFNSKPKVVCPRCKKENITIYYENATCNECGYSQTKKRFEDAYKIKYSKNKSC